MIIRSKISGYNLYFQIFLDFFYLRWTKLIFGQAYVLEMYISVPSCIIHLIHIWNEFRFCFRHGHTFILYNNRLIWAEWWVFTHSFHFYCCKKKQFIKIIINQKFIFFIQPKKNNISPVHHQCVTLVCSLPFIYFSYFLCTLKARFIAKKFVHGKCKMKKNEWNKVKKKKNSPFVNAWRNKIGSFFLFLVKNITSSLLFWGF